MMKKEMMIFRSAERSINIRPQDRDVNYGDAKSINEYLQHGWNVRSYVVMTGYIEYVLEREINEK